MVASIIKSRKRQLAPVALCAAIAVAAFAAGVAVAAQPHMQAALGYLQSAKGELQGASADKGGHRQRAIGLINQTIAEVQAGVAAGM